MTTFLSNFMRAARKITDAERCIAFDNDMNMQDQVNVDAAELQKKSFTELVTASVEQAIQQGEAIIANNLIQNPAEAPQTNVHLKDLRMIVAIPVNGYGAIYLDQPIRKGVFERETVDKITEMAARLSHSGQTTMSEEELTAMYHEI